MTDCKEELEEFQLAQQMKDNYCDKSGKETDPIKVAEILHKLGQVYRKRSPDKISLIKSVGLFNAAIARNPANVNQIKSDLYATCQDILQQAKAKNENSDLIKKAKQVKASIQELRNKVEEFLKTSVPKIPEKLKKKDLKKQKVSAIKTINNIIAGKYKQIMADLAQYCQDRLKKPPCEYAIVGMGSLARQEITPYSDFEHIILLCDDKNYKSHLEYFRWFSVIFHIVILNLQETIIPSLNISSLNGNDSKLGNWYYDAITPRGVSFDGMMPHACKFPLGRHQYTKDKKFTTELIKPVSEMLEYLSSDADIKNGYHLADILTRTCFVFGNENICKQFCNGARKYREGKSNTDTISDVQQQVIKDLNSFSARFQLTSLKTHDNINIKQLVYRSSTIFISALGRLYNSSANSCFDICDDMVKSSKLTFKSADALQYAIAVACEMRLRVYTENKSQCDNFVNLKQDSKNIDKFLEIVGIASTINYFQIVYCLQCEVAKQLNLTKLHFYSDPQLINFTIGLVFGINNFLTPKNLKITFWNVKQFDFDKCIKKLGKTKLSGKKSEQFSQTYSSNIDQILSIAELLRSANAPDEALEFYKELQRVYYSNPNGYSRNLHLAWTNNQIGLCLLELNRYNDAHSHLITALQMQQNISSDAERDTTTSLFFVLGICNYNLHQYNDALKYLKQALEICQNITVDVALDRSIAAILHQIGLCLMRLQKHNEALDYFNNSYKIFEKTTFNSNKDRSFSTNLNNVGYCLMDLHQYHDALNYLKRAHDIKLNTLVDVDNDLSFAATLSNIGRCLVGLNQFDESWKYLEQSLEIKLNRTLDEKKDHRIAYNYNYMGECLMGKQQFSDALNYFQSAHKIYEAITTNPKKDIILANTLKNSGFCLLNLLDYTDALIYLKKSLKIYTNLPMSQHITNTTEVIRSKIKQCAKELDSV